MHLIHAGLSLHGLLRGTWQDTDLVDLERGLPELASRLERVAESPRFGSGRTPASVTQAAMTLGIERVKHVVVWHTVLQSLDEDGVSEAIALGGHGYIQAESQGFDAFSGLSLGLCACLGDRLLREARTPSAAVLRLVEASGGGAQLEELVFGRSRDRALCEWIRNADLPNDLGQLARPMPGSREHAFVESLRARASGEDCWTIPGVSHELARMLCAKVLPVAAPGGRDPSAVVAAVVGVLEERAALDARIEALMEDVEMLKDELGATQVRAGSGLLGQAEILDRVSMEVGRARRYKRHLSLVAVGIDPADYPIDGQLVLEHMASFFQAAFRSSDAVGIFDRTKLIVILPETPVAGARLFGERTEYAMRKKPFEHDGVVIPLRPRLYGSSLEQQGDQDGNGMLFTVMDGVDAMAADERVKWNTHGQSVWRVNG